MVLRNIDIAGAGLLAERLRARLESTSIRVPTGVVKPTASFGCAALSECADDDTKTLVNLADQRLLRAKRTGRNRVVFQDE